MTIEERVTLLERAIYSQSEENAFLLTEIARFKTEIKAWLFFMALAALVIVVYGIVSFL